jgi:DNA-binding Lrp family transcriptional regulator
MTSSEIRHPIFGEDDAEIERVLRAAQFSVDRLPQTKIAARLKVHASTVSRWIDRAEREGILRTTIVVPRCRDLEVKIGNFLTERGVRQIKIVPNGPGKNTENLARAAASLLMRTLIEVDDVKPLGEPIRIVFACGETVLRTIEYLIDHLKEYLITEGNYFRHTVFNVYPSTIYGDFEIRSFHAHMAVMFFSILVRLEIPREQMEIRAFTPQLPDDFYKFTFRDRESFLTSSRIGGFIERMKEKADIFIMGVGTAKTNEYQEILKNIDVP